MTRRATTALAALLASAGLLAAAVPAAAQEEPGSLEVVSIDKRDFPDVTVVVSPTGAPGGLTDESFELRQDGKERPVSAEALQGSDIEVAVVIDTSGSIAGAPLDAAKSAAIAFLDQMKSGTRVVVVGFGDVPYVAQPMTTDGGAASAAVQALQASGDTALYDAVNTALAQFSPDAQRSIVLLSDGRNESLSPTSLESVTATLSTAGVAFFGVNLETPASDPAAMQAMADAAGGQAINASDPDALAGVYDDIAVTVTNQYAITFRSVNGAGPSEIAVTLKEGDVELSAERVIELPAAPEPEEIAAAQPTLVKDPGNDWALPVGLGAVFLALLIGSFLLMQPRKRDRKSIVERARLARKGFHMGQLTEITHRATQIVERNLEERGRRRGFTDALEHAGIPLRPGEFVVLAASTAFAGFAFGFVLWGPLVGLVVAGVVGLGFRMSVSVLAERRRSKFGSQLSDTLQLLSGSLRAGYGLLQAIDAVAREADSPTAEEFGRIVIETRLGRNVSESLHALAKRMGNEDFEWVVQAIDIHREVGGDLTEVLDTVAGTIRERERIRRQIKALSAEGRLSAAILFLLPFVMFVAITFLNPDYMKELTDTTFGRVLLSIGATMLLVGGMWLRKIVKLEF